MKLALLWKQGALKTAAWCPGRSGGQQASHVALALGTTVGLMKIPSTARGCRPDEVG